MSLGKVIRARSPSMPSKRTRPSAAIPLQIRFKLKAWPLQDRASIVLTRTAGWFWLPTNSNTLHISQGSHSIQLSHRQAHLTGQQLPAPVAHVDGLSPRQLNHSRSSLKGLMLPQSKARTGQLKARVKETRHVVVLAWAQVHSKI